MMSPGKASATMNDRYRWVNRGGDQYLTSSDGSIRASLIWGAEHIDVRLDIDGTVRDVWHDMDDAKDFVGDILDGLIDELNSLAMPRPSAAPTGVLPGVDDAEWPGGVFQVLSNDCLYWKRGRPTDYGNSYIFKDGIARTGFDYHAGWKTYFGDEFETFDTALEAMLWCELKDAQVKLRVLQSEN